MSSEWTLAVDFGTCFTVAAAADNDRVEVIDIVGNGSLRMPSSVWFGDGEVAVGADAVNRAVSDPAGFVRSPKRLIGRQEDCIIAGRPVSVHSLVSAVLAHVWQTSLAQRAGYRPAAIRLTCPAGWAESKRAALVLAAQEAGMTGVTLVDEPVAAALRLSRRNLAEGETVAIYDLGGGTFDAALLSRDLSVEEGFRLVGPPVGLDPLGGERFDQKVLEYLCSNSPQLMNHPDLDDLLNPPDERWRRARAETESLVCQAKENLSRSQATEIWIAGLEERVQLNREEFNGLIQPEIVRSLDKLGTLLSQCGVTAADLSALFLIGGSSRIPLVPQLAWERLGIEPITQDDPKAVVALGAAVFGAQNGSNSREALFTEDLTPRKVEGQLQPTASKGYSRGRHVLSLENVGAVPAIVSVAALDEDDRIDLHVEPSSLTVEPFSHREVEIVASARKTSRRGRTFPFECIVEVSGRSRQQLSASYTRRPLPLVPAVATVVAMCLLIGLFLGGGFKLASGSQSSTKHAVTSSQLGASVGGPSSVAGGKSAGDPGNSAGGAGSLVAGGGTVPGGHLVGSGGSVGRNSNAIASPGGAAGSPGGAAGSRGGAPGSPGSGAGSSGGGTGSSGGGTGSSSAGSGTGDRQSGSTLLVTVTPTNASRSYGASNPSFLVTYAIGGGPNATGIPGLSGTPTCTTTATPDSDAGSYPITCTQGTLSGSDYSFEFAPGSLTVTTGLATLVTSNATSTENGYLPKAPVSFTATLTSSLTKEPLSGFTVNFVDTSSGSSLCGGTTDASGVVSVTCNLNAPAVSGFYQTPTKSFIATVAATTNYSAATSNTAST
jgi:actin-like ATPase involved in cell morphogenesis